MTGLIPHAALVTTAVGVVMIRLGLSKGRLQLRKVERQCPSCGRVIEGAVCRTCTRVNR